MASRVASTIVGNTGRLHPNEDRTYVQFEASSHCCESCTDGCAGEGRSSSSPVDLEVVFRDDMPEGSLDIEIRWSAFGKPQRLLLDSWAADTLASLLRQAHLGDGAGWKVGQ